MSAGRDLCAGYRHLGWGGAFEFVVLNDEECALSSRGNLGCGRTSVFRTASAGGVALQSLSEDAA